MNDTLILLDGHALIEHKLGQMRHKDCPSELFRRRLREVGMILAAVVSDHLSVTSIDIPTPLEITQGKKLSTHPVIIPILRAGLGLAEGIAAVITEADWGHIGLKRNEENLLPEHLAGSRILSKPYAVDEVEHSLRQLIARRVESLQNA